uniref:Uncharacterized protein n=1 Tax=Glossina palpalis gambiensis TaxID=67801 RepID=A0A1B0BNG6_9MUSC
MCMCVNDKKVVSCTNFSDPHNVTSQPGGAYIYSLPQCTPKIYIYYILVGCKLEKKNRECNKQKNSHSALSAFQFAPVAELISPQPSFRFRALNTYLRRHYCIFLLPVWLMVFLKCAHHARMLRYFTLQIPETIFKVTCPWLGELYNTASLRGSIRISIEDILIIEKSEEDMTKDAANKRRNRTFCSFY